MRVQHIPWADLLLNHVETGLFDIHGLLFLVAAEWAKLIKNDLFIFYALSKVNLSPLIAFYQALPQVYATDAKTSWPNRPYNNTSPERRPMSAMTR